MPLAADVAGAVVLKLVLLVAAMVAFPAITTQLTIRQRAWIGAWIPERLVGRCGHSNESSAISTLRNVSSSQAQFQASAVLDEDADGAGEFGTFHEMSGVAAVRGTRAVLDPPVLSGASRTFTASGEVARGGYLFRMWLVGKGGTWTGETASGLAAGVVHPKTSASRWRCSAWPAGYDRTGLRTFFIDETGGIWTTEASAYSGTGGGPAPDAAAPAAATLPASAGSVTGPDGNVWRRVN